jgi:hypothetical protein
VEATGVGVEESHDVEGRHLCVEGVGILEVVVPDLVNGVPEDLSGAALGRFVGGEVVEAGFVGRFRSDTNDRGGVVRNAPIVEWEPDGNGKGVTAMVGGIPCGLREESNEGMDPLEEVKGDLDKMNKKVKGAIGKTHRSYGGGKKEEIKSCHRHQGRGQGREGEEEHKRFQTYRTDGCISGEPSSSQ